MIYDLASKLLGLAADGLASNGVSVPERQYVNPGADVAFDCEQLTVRLSRIIPNMQGADTPYPVITHRKLFKSAEMFVTLTRCVPVMHNNGDPPNVDEQNAAAQGLLDDAIAMRVTLEDIEHHHLLVPANVPVSVGELRTVGPLGGFAAIEMMYTVMLVSNPAGWVG